jgi:2-dehydro-3-deoxygluconokinase
MLLLQAPPPESLTNASHLLVDIAGAEFNAVAAIARAGGRTALLSRVGDDEPGQRVLLAMAALNVERNLTTTDSHHPTGLFLRSTPADGSRRVVYYRKGSAASTMNVSDADRLWSTEPPRAVIMSGITAALGDGPRQLIDAVATKAASHNTAVVVDVNARPALGNSAEVIASIRRILAKTDLLVLGDDESGLIFDTTSPFEVFAAARKAGVKEIVLKGGARGCWFAGDRGEPIHMPSLAATVVDSVGAGDAFLGGYLSARLVGASAHAAAALGSDFAARVIGAVGDTTGLPSKETAAIAIDKASLEQSQRTQDRW